MKSLADSCMEALRLMRTDDRQQEAFIVAVEKGSINDLDNI